LLHPPRRLGTLVNATDHTAQITATLLFGLDFYRKRIIDGCSNRLYFQVTEGRIVQNGNLTGQTTNAETVATVGCQIHFKPDIVQLEVLTDICANWRISRQLKQTF